jgi:hypothetical protein
VWALQCDIRKFFASIDHGTLLDILRRSIVDQDVLWLLEKVIGSFPSISTGVGLPLGNLTSQLFVNVYMNEFDQFMKQGLRVRCYVRYADDFVVLSSERAYLQAILPDIREYLRDMLRLELHPDKLKLRTLASGVDFLGWVHFPDHRVVRSATKRRLLRRLGRSPYDEDVRKSYLGLIKHGNAQKLLRKIEGLVGEGSCLL